MRKNPKIRILSCLLVASLCLTNFSATAFATNNGYYASDENGGSIPPEPITDITISTENIDFSVPESGQPLTPDGNLSLIDDILQNEGISQRDQLQEKQFVTVQTKSGQYFYLVIDRNGNTENVYFLNLVDDSDLMALLEDGDMEATPLACSCTDKCVVGLVNTSCEICCVNMTECVGKEPKPVEQDQTDDQQEEEPTEKPETNKPGGVIMIILMLAVIGGYVFYCFRIKFSKGKSGGSTNLNDYDYGTDDDEYMEFESYEDNEIKTEIDGEDRQN